MMNQDFISSSVILFSHDHRNFAEILYGQVTYRDVFE